MALTADKGPLRKRPIRFLYADEVDLIEPGPEDKAEAARLLAELHEAADRLGMKFDLGFPTLLGGVEK